MLHIDEGSKLLISSPQKAPKNASVLRHSEAGSVAHVDQQAGWLSERLSLFLH